MVWDGEGVGGGIVYFFAFSSIIYIEAVFRPVASIICIVINTLLTLVSRNRGNVVSNLKIIVLRNEFE